MATEQICVGTAGWSYADWEGCVYSSGKAADRLRTVVQHLDSVEIDSSFYRPPSPRMAESWLQTVAPAPAFQFLAKAWQRFTHERTSRWSPAEFALFADGLAPLREARRLAAVLFQFPWSFRYEPRNLAWLRAVAEAFAEWPVAVEVRHDSWARAGVEDFFRQQRFIYCNVDQPQLAHCLAPAEHATASTGYYRLHGRNAANWFREPQDVYGGRYDYRYSATELEELLPRIRRVAHQAQRTFVIFNNHKDGKAFANALQLKARLQPATTVRAPATLLARFPDLRGILRPAGAEQLPLV